MRSVCQVQVQRMGLRRSFRLTRLEALSARLSRAGTSIRLTRREAGALALPQCDHVRTSASHTQWHCRGRLRNSRGRGCKSSLFAEYDVDPHRHTTSVPSSVHCLAGAPELVQFTWHGVTNTNCTCANVDDAFVSVQMKCVCPICDGWSTLRLNASLYVW